MVDRRKVAKEEAKNKKKELKTFRFRENLGGQKTVKQFCCFH